MSSQRRGVRERVPSLVGRTAELRTVHRWLDGGTQLVTLLGPGGVGKTRLARAVMAERAERTWFCDLAEARGQDDFEAIVAATLGLDPKIDLERHLARRGAGLVALDNFEQLPASAGAAVERWLSAGSRVAFLVTSRRPIGCSAEQRIVLSPLDVDDGIALLIARARMVAPSFAWEHAARDGLAAIVERLDGLPLALELAAARLAVLSPSELLARLSDRFAVLRGDRSGATPRHESLAAAIDWSYDLLGANERAALRTCAVFRGGFLLADLEHVHRDDDGSPGTVLDRVHALVDHSLLAPAPQTSPDAARRWTLLESVRDHVERASAAHRDERERAELRHALRYTDILAPERWPELSVVSAESANLAVIVERFEHSRPDLACRAITALDPWLHARGPSHDHVRWLGRGVDLARDAADPALEATVLLARGHANAIAGSIDAAEADIVRAGALARSHVLARTAVHADAALGVIDQRRGKLPEARARYVAALDSMRRVGDLGGEAETHRRIGVLHMLDGEHEEARRRLDAARALYASLGARRAMATALGDLGIVELELAADDTARAHLEEAITIVAELGDRRREAILASNLALLDHQCGRLSESRARWLSSLAVHEEIGNRRFEAFACSGLGAVLLELRDPSGAEQALSRARATFADVGDARFEGLVLARLAAVRACAGDGAGADTLFAEARARLAETPERWWCRAIETLETLRAPASAAVGAYAIRSDAPIASSDRIAARIVAAWQDRAGPPAVQSATTPRGETAIVVSSDGAWFRLGTRPRVALATRSALRGIFARLVEERIVRAGATLSPTELVAAGWPGERMTAGSARTRLYVAVRTLRELGLRDVLVTSRGGYLLHASVPIDVARGDEWPE